MKVHLPLSFDDRQCLMVFGGSFRKLSTVHLDTAFDYLHFSVQLLHPPPSEEF